MIYHDNAYHLVLINIFKRTTCLKRVQYAYISPYHWRRTWCDLTAMLLWMMVGIGVIQKSHELNWGEEAKKFRKLFHISWEKPWFPVKKHETWSRWRQLQGFQWYDSVGSQHKSIAHISNILMKLLNTPIKSYHHIVSHGLVNRHIAALPRLAAWRVWWGFSSTPRSWDAGMKSECPCRWFGLKYGMLWEGPLWTLLLFWKNLLAS